LSDKKISHPINIIELIFPIIFGNLINLTIRHLKFIRFIWVIVISVSAHAGQLPEADIKKCLDLIYSMKFDSARMAVDQYHEKVGDHPSWYLLQAYLLRWREMPLTDASAHCEDYMKILDSAIQSAEQVTKKSPDDLQALYFTMAARLMKAELHANSNSFARAVLEGKAALSIIKKGFDLYEQYPEFYISTALYNYYIEHYRDQSFVYSSLLWPFPDGDQQLGMKLLKSGYEKGIFTSVECLLYLSHINFKLESNPQKALEYSKQLFERYPSNLKFTEILIENYLACHQYKAASDLNSALLNSSNNYFLARGYLFKGMMLQEYYHNSTKALQYLDKAESLLDPKEHLMSVLYLEKARIYHLKDDIKAQMFGKKAKKIARYDYVHDSVDQIGVD